MTAMAELKQSLAGLATATQRGSFVSLQETDGFGAQHALLKLADKSLLLLSLRRCELRAASLVNVANKSATGNQHFCSNWVCEGAQPTVRSLNDTVAMF